MRVGLNLIFLVPGETGGMEVAARALLPELVRAAPDVEFTAFINRETAEAEAGPWSSLMTSVTVSVRAANRVEWVRGEQQHLPRLAAEAGIDLLHSLGNTAPAWGSFRRVVTVHDLIYRVHPEAHDGVLAYGARALVRLATARTDRIVAVSQSTRRDLTRFLHVRPDRIDVVPQGVAPPPAVVPVEEAELRRSLDLGERPVLLSVSAKRPHKNLPRLLDALAAIPPERRPMVVLPGYGTWHEDELREQTERLGLSDDVRFLGWLATEQLEGLYAVAAAVVFPSLYEGFGLPVLEAMSRGVPVACSNTSSLPEVAGDAAVLFDPTDTAAIASAIERLVRDDALRGELARRGAERAATFSWERTARGTLAAYERTLAVPRRPGLRRLRR